MSIRTMPILICDGCGTVISMDFYITRQPIDQKIVSQDEASAPERHFCCTACEGWWNAQFPPEGVWGPAWDERHWWCENVGPCSERARVRTAHEAHPLVDMDFHEKDPEPIP